MSKPAPRPRSTNCCGTEPGRCGRRYTDMDWTYLFFSFDGRISRKPYWIATCALIAATFISIWIQVYVAEPRLGAILNLALLYPDLAVMVKRAHDRQMPIWIVLASAILAT